METMSRRLERMLSTAAAALCRERHGFSLNMPQRPTAGLLGLVSRDPGGLSPQATSVKLCIASLSRSQVSFWSKSWSRSGFTDQRYLKYTLIRPNILRRPKCVCAEFDTSTSFSSSLRNLLVSRFRAKTGSQSISHMTGFMVNALI